MTENTAKTGRKLFLLSPASTSGKRADLLFNNKARFPLARRLHDGEEVPIGEIFSFLSGLYFRGKLAYAERFADGGLGGGNVLVITSNRGLLTPSTEITLQELKAFSKTPIGLDNRDYRAPMEKDIGSIASDLEGDASVVLLGSIATPKYIDVLLPALGARLVFPEGFPGLGDMSRGAILLRSVRNDVELNYLPVNSLEIRRSRR